MVVENADVNVCVRSVFVLVVVATEVSFKSCLKIIISQNVIEWVLLLIRWQEGNAAVKEQFARQSLEFLAEDG